MSNVLTVERLDVQRLKRAQRKLDKALAERDAAIRLASEAGASFREIAEYVGLSHMTVRTIIQGRP